MSRRKRRARRNPGGLFDNLGLFDFKPSWQKFVLGVFLIHLVSRSRAAAKTAEGADRVLKGWRA